jgi:hypothetical protein
LANPKIEPVWNSTVSEYLTDEAGEMRAVTLKNLVTGAESELELKCVFVAIGHVPNSGFLGDLVDKDENGYILQNPGRTATKTEGLFAAGDVADHYYRQAVTAAGQGCAAALEAERYPRRPRVKAAPKARIPGWTGGFWKLSFRSHDLEIRCRRLAACHWRASPRRRRRKAISSGRMPTVWSVCFAEPEADLDTDGITNLMAYAFDLAPMNDMPRLGTSSRRWPSSATRRSRS